MTRIACGTTISRKVEPRDSPSEEPASICPLCTDRMPARTISAMKAAGIGRQRQRQRHEFRNDARAAGEIEPLELRHLERERLAEHQRRQQRQPDQQAQHIGPDRRSACPLKQLPARIAAQQPATPTIAISDGDDERRQARLCRSALE